MKQSQIADQLGLSSSTIQRYRNDINMLSQYRISVNNTNKRTKKAKNTDFENNSHHEAVVKRPQMTSKHLKQNLIKKQIVLKAGSMHENIEKNEHYLDKILKNNNT